MEPVRIIVIYKGYKAQWLDITEVDTGIFKAVPVKPNKAQDHYWQTFYFAKKGSIWISEPEQPDEIISDIVKDLNL
jgi:hypothetical protein